MINAVKVSAGDFNGPVIEWVFPPVDYAEDKMVDEKRIRVLNDLVLQIEDEEERERHLSQISSDMTSEDCEEMIFTILTSRMSVK